MSQSQFADPLATPGYDVDPWSGTQSPTRVSTPSLPVAPVASTSAGVASSHPALDAFLGECSSELILAIADLIRRPAHRLSGSLATAGPQSERRDLAVHPSEVARNSPTERSRCRKGEYL